MSFLVARGLSIVGPALASVCNLRWCRWPPLHITRAAFHHIKGCHVAGCHLHVTRHFFSLGEGLPNGMQPRIQHAGWGRSECPSLAGILKLDKYLLSDNEL